MRSSALIDDDSKKATASHNRGGFRVYSAILFFAEKADFVLARFFGSIQSPVAHFQQFLKILSVSVISRAASSADACSESAEFGPFRESAQNAVLPGRKICSHNFAVFGEILEEQTVCRKNIFFFIVNYYSKGHTVENNLKLGVNVVLRGYVVCDAAGTENRSVLVNQRRFVGLELPHTFLGLDLLVKKAGFARVYDNLLMR